MYEPPSQKMKDTPKGSSKGISPTALMLREEAEPELKALLKPRGPPLTVQRVSPKIDSQTRQMVKGREAQDFATCNPLASFWGGGHMPGSDNHLLCYVTVIAKNRKPGEGNPQLLQMAEEAAERYCCLW